MSTVIIDYDSGNLHSAQKAFALMAQDTGTGPVVVSSDAHIISKADRIVLPGDGAFPHCQNALFSRTDIFEALNESVKVRGVPFLGICVGMQMLASMGYEYKSTKGLGWIEGEINKITPQDQSLKIPHMGWNELVIHQEHPILNGVKNGDHVYFVHSYAMAVTDPKNLIATTQYGAPITALIGKDNVMGMQFHPEKSQSIGLKFIQNFLNWAP